MLKSVCIQLFILAGVILCGCRRGELAECFSLTVLMDTDPQNKLYLFYKGENDSIRMDSAVYEDGKFELEGCVKYPQKALLRLDRRKPTFFEDAVKFTNDAMFVFLERGDIQVKACKALRDSRLSGTPSNEDLQVYTDSVRFYRDWLDGYRERYKMAYCNRDEETFLSLSKENEYMEQRLKTAEQKFFNSHSNSLVALDWLIRSHNIVREKAEVVSLFNRLDAGVKTSIPGEKYRALLDSTLAVEIGSLGPDFVAKNRDGREIALNSFRGRYVLLDFWASWCGPCRQENMQVLKVYERFKDRGFAVLGYSLDTNREAWIGAVEKDDLPWEQLSGLHDGAIDVAKLYGVTAIPSNFLINPDGKIVGIDLRGKSLENELEVLLK